MLQTAFRPSCMNRPIVFEWHKRFKEGRESVRDDERCKRSKEVNRPELIGKGLELGLLCWGFKEFRKRFHRKNPTLFKSDQWHFHQDNSLVDNSILVTDYLTKMGIKTVWETQKQRNGFDAPYSRDVIPVTFGYSLSSQAVVMRELRRWKRLW